MSSMTMLGANDETPALRTVDAQVTEKDKSNIQGLEEGQKLSGKGAGDNDLVWTKEEERKVLRKVDLAIIPWMTFIYVCSQIDRGNLANASIMNLETPESTMFHQLGLQGTNYNTAVSVFFIGYVLAEIPSNLLLTRVRPSVQIARICILWGICAALMGATFNFGSLVACRIFLGLFEGGLTPGIIFYLGFWYRKHERASRWAFIYSGSGIAGSFSGLIAYAVARMNGVGGLAGWRWLFILEGLPTILGGVLSFFIIPNYPTTCRFLKGRELDIQIARLPPNAPTQATLHFDKAQLWDAFKNVQVWILCLCSVSLITVLYAGAYFAPRIITGMGFDSYKTQLLSVGLAVCGATYMILISLVSEKTKERGWVIVGTLIPPIIGWSLLATIQQNNSPNTNYGILYLTSIATGSVPALFTYCVQNVKGVTKSATVSAMVVGMGNVGGALGGQVYQPSDAPLFKTGHLVNAILLGVAVLCILAIKVMNKVAPHISVEKDDTSE